MSRQKALPLSLAIQQPAAESQKSSLAFVPFNRIKIIEGGVEGLEEFLRKNKYLANRDPLASDAFVIVIGHRHFAYTRKQFCYLVSKLLRIRPDRLSRTALRNIFNLYEHAANQIVNPHERPSEIAVVVRNGKLRGAWLAVPNVGERFSVPQRFITNTQGLSREEMLQGRTYEREKGLHIIDDIEVHALNPALTKRATRADGSPIDSNQIPARPHPTREQKLVRTPHMDLSKTNLQPGDSFQVSVYADMSATRPGEFATDIVIKAPNSLVKFPVEVCLVGTAHFRITGRRVKKIVINRKLPTSDIAIFDVQVEADIADFRGATLIATFSYNGRPSGSVSRSFETVTIGGGKCKRPAGRRQVSEFPSGVKPPRILIDPAAIPPDLTIVITNPENDGKKFDCFVRTPHLPAYKKWRYKLWKLSDATTGEIVTGFFNEFTKSGNTNEERLASLRGAGRDLFNVAQSVIADVFWKLIDSKKPFTTIYIVSQEPHIPWELMIPSRTKMNVTRPEIRAPLGVEFSVGRWICDDHLSPSQVVPLNKGCVFAPDYPEPTPQDCPARLPNAKREALFVRKNFNGRMISPAIFKELKAAMGKIKGTVWHFICHGAASTGKAQEIYLEDYHTLSSIQLGGIAELETACRTNNPLIFLNACEVGRTTPALVGVGGFAQKFIELGANCVIAPLWSVRDGCAHKVALEFYEAITESPATPFAEIIKKIRNKTYSNKNGGEDTYAAYCFYGDPLAACRGVSSGHQV